MTLIDDVRKLQDDNRQLRRELDELKKLSNTQDERISGKTGLYSVIDGLVTEVRSLRKAAYWIAGLIIVSSVGFAFSVLALVPG